MPSMKSAANAATTQTDSRLQKNNNSLQLKSVFRAKEESAEELSPPSGFAFTSEGNLVLADDFNHRIQIYDRGHNLIQSFGGKGKHPGEFHYPRGLAVDAQGNIYVTDSWNHRVQKFDGAGNHLLSIGSCGEGKGQLNEPYDVLIDPGGDIFVVERYNHRIQIFDSEGKSKGWIGDRGSVLEEQLATIYETPSHLFSPPAFEFPTSIARDSFGNTFISDSGNHRIVKFDRQWNRIGCFGERGSGEGQFEYPLCVAVGPNDLLYVADLNNDRVQIFSNTGKFITEIREAGDSLPIKAPGLTAVDTEGTLYVGLTFDTRLMAFQTVPQPAIEFIAARIESNPQNSALFYHWGLLFEQAGECKSALKSYGKAVENLSSSAQASDAETGFIPDLLVQFSRLALQMADQTVEPHLLKGLETLNRRIDRDRQAVVDTHKAWEKAAADHNQKLIEEQKLILEQREDPRTFSKELFQAESQDKKLFRQLRADFYTYRKSVQQGSEYFGNLLSFKPTDTGLKTCLDAFEKRFTEIVRLMLDLLDLKEKNEEAMVQSFGEMQSQEGKWGSFLVRSNTNLRVIDVLRQFHFEIRSLIASIKEASLIFPQNSGVAEALQRQLIGSPASERIFKVLSGFQEEWTFHKPLEIVLSDIMDSWIALSGASQAGTLDIEKLHPMPFDSEESNLPEILQSLLVQGAPLKNTADGLMCGARVYSAHTIPTDALPWIKTLQSTLKNQAVYETKHQEVRQQLEDLAQQKQELETNLTRVNPQDKKAPITLQNNIAVVGFQVSILRRMILTMEINETQNLCRLVTGTALLMVSENQKAHSELTNLLQSIDAFQSGLEAKIQQGLQNRKHLAFEVSRLNGDLTAINENNRVEELNQSLQMQDQMTQSQLRLEKLEHSLNRYFKIRNLLEKLLRFKEQIASEEQPNANPDPQSLFKFSFGNSGPLTQNLPQPHGISVTRSGDLIFADYENHRVCRFSNQGIYKQHFGHWGNAPGCFKYPIYVQEDGQDFLYVVDEKNTRVQKFTPEGNFKLSFGDREESGQRLGAIFSLSIDSKDQIWVPDASHNRIQIYNSEGKLVRTLQGENLDQPVSVCCLKNGDYLVGDRSDALLKHFSADGAFIRRLDKPGLGFDELYFLAHHPKHGIFATDYWNQQILHLNHTLEVISVMRNGGRRAGQFGKLGGLAVDGDRLLVADFENFRIQVFGLSNSSAR